MRAVKGSLVASKPVSLSKAAAILSRFAASGSCSRRDVSAHVRRASDAFDELVLAKRELRAARKRSELLDADEPRRKKRRSRGEGIGGGDSESGGVGPARCGAGDRSEEASDGDGGRPKKRWKPTGAEAERSVLYAVKDENVTIPGGELVDISTKSGYEAASFGGFGVVGLELTNGKGTTKKKKEEKKPQVVSSDERSDFAGLQTKNGGLEEEEEKTEKDEKKVNERKKKERNVNGACVEERHANEEEVRKKAVSCKQSNHSRKGKVDMEEGRHANENKKKRNNKENEVGSTEVKPDIDQEMVNNFDRKEDVGKRRKKKSEMEERYEI